MKNKQKYNILIIFGFILTFTPLIIFGIALIIYGSSNSRTIPTIKDSDTESNSIPSKQTKSRDNFDNQLTLPKYLDEYCEYCGSKLLPGDRKCEYCGAKVKRKCKND